MGNSALPKINGRRFKGMLVRWGGGCLPAYMEVCRRLSKHRGLSYSMARGIARRLFLPRPVEYDEFGDLSKDEQFISRLVSKGIQVFRDEQADRLHHPDLPLCEGEEKKVTIEAETRRPDCELVPAAGSVGAERAVLPVGDASPADGGEVFRGASEVVDGVGVQADARLRALEGLPVSCNDAGRRFSWLLANIGESRPDWAGAPDQQAIQLLQFCSKSTDAQSKVTGMLIKHALEEWGREGGGLSDDGRDLSGLCDRLRSVAQASTFDGYTTAGRTEVEVQG